MADVIRGSVDVLLAQHEGSDDERRRSRALGAAGRFRSGRRDLAKRHDRHLAEIFGQ